MKKFYVGAYQVRKGLRGAEGRLAAKILMIYKCILMLIVIVKI